MSPLSLSGPEFLAFWSVGALVIAGITLAVRRVVAGPGASTAELEALTATVSPAEIAHLAGGIDRAIEAAIAGLVHSGALIVDNGRLRASDTPPQLPHGVYRGTADAGELPLVERHVLDEVRRDPGMRIAVLIAALRWLDTPLTERRERDGLRFPAHSAVRAWIYAPGVLWLSLGLVKVLVGMARQRPVGFLAALLVVGAVVLVRCKPPRLMTRGTQLIRHLTDGAHGLVATSQTAPQQLSASELTLAYALFGATGVAVTLAMLMPSYQRMLEVATVDTGGSSSGSSCGSGCGSGCGGGCGGCGGCS